MLIHLIAAARPNFMKIAPLYHELKKESWAKPVIVHTGQHYDINMSDVFFQDLSLPEPDIHLGIGSGSHAEQTGQIMVAYEKVLHKTHPDLVIVVGDVNSTMACTVASTKVIYSNEHSHGKRPLVAHLEAGLRSFDRTMPEEINRLVTDALADILWTPSVDGDENLIKEGIPQNKIQRVGNIMIDSMELVRSKIESEAVYEEYGLKQGNYAVVTLHRPSNVDEPNKLKKICQTLIKQSDKIPMIFPVHPRTRKYMEVAKLKVHPRTRKYMEVAKLNGDLNKASNLIILRPVSYRNFMNLLFHCRMAITDSGGLQEETTYLGIPCLTLRPNTERPITITEGTNQLCNINDLKEKIDTLLTDTQSKNCRIDLWDGRTAPRIVSAIKEMRNRSI